MTHIGEQQLAPTGIAVFNPAFDVTPARLIGAIITEQIFRINGLGQLLITSIQSADVPMVQTLTFIFAVLIVIFNLVADLTYGLLDPRIRYE